jgi:acyl-CoA synthetase (AMP-forming)/AMP-acid ligase II
MGHSVERWAALLDVLEWRAGRESAQTTKPAYTFLRDGTEPGGAVTYRDLLARSQDASARFGEAAGPGDRVLLLYPPGLDFLCAFLGAVCAGLIAVPAYLPRPQEIDARIRSMAIDAGPRLAATTSEHSARIRAQFGADPSLSAIGVIDAGATAQAAPRPWPSRPRGSDVAHLQYTSGSTAAPKGVKVTHANLLYNLRDMDEGWRHDESSTIVSWLPPFHDMGLVYGLLGPLYTGVPGVLMPPVSFIQRPIRWLQAISRHRGTHSAAPNFAYDLCVRKIKEQDRAPLDLGCWRVAINGAEPVRADTLQRFADAFAPAGFRRAAFAPGYGLAEATLKVTAVRSDEEPVVSRFSATGLEQGIVASPANAADSRVLVACGAPLLDTTVAIVDPDRHRAAPDRVGEIWVGGPSVAAGYWAGGVESDAAFIATLAGEDEHTFLRTGDLGFVSGGQLYVAGRIKDLIIVRGQNYYPQDIELTVEQSHAGFLHGSCAAFGIDADGEERLIVLQEVERHFKKEQQREAVEAIRQRVALAHELHVFDAVLLKQGGIPKTSSGKIQRQACRTAYERGTLRGRIDEPHDPA